METPDKYIDDDLVKSHHDEELSQNSNEELIDFKKSPASSASPPNKLAPISSG